MRVHVFKRNIVIAGLLAGWISGAHAEALVDMTFEDIGGGASVFDPAPDGVASAFRFSPHNEGTATPDSSNGGRICYTGSNCFSTDVNIVDASAAASGFSTGFLFAGQAFVPKTLGPVVADVTNNVLSISSLPFAGDYGGVQFTLGPESSMQYANDGCNTAIFPHIPLSVDWVSRVGETDVYLYKLRWNSCIQSASGDVTPPPAPGTNSPFDQFSAHWIVEGKLTVEDTTAPVIVSTTPADLATGVSSTAPVSVTFSEPMDPATVDTASFVVKTAGGANECATITASNNNKTFTCTPAGGQFTNNQQFTATFANTITDDVSKIRGGGTRTNAFAGATITFDVGVPDLTPPTIASVSPLDASTDVAVNATLSVTFDEPMDVNVTAAAISLMTGGAAVPATVTSSDGVTFTITPQSGALSNNTVYTIAVAATASDATGNLLSAASSTTFTTIASATLTAQTPSGSGSASVSVDTSLGLSMVALDVLAQSQVTGAPPAEVDFADEFVSYTINGVTAGQAQVTISFPSPINGKTLYKVINGVYTELKEGTATGEYQVVNSNTITMTVADNGPQDADPTAGVISDPIVAGTPQNLPVPGSLSGGCSVTGMDVNVLDRFDMVVLLALIFVFGGWRLLARSVLRP